MYQCKIGNFRWTQDLRPQHKDIIKKIFCGNLAIFLQKCLHIHIFIHHHQTTIGQRGSAVINKHFRNMILLSPAFIIILQPIYIWNIWQIYVWKCNSLYIECTLLISQDHYLVCRKMLYNVLWTIYSLQFTVYTVEWTMNSVQFTVHIVQSKLFRT